MVNLKIMRDFPTHNVRQNIWPCPDSMLYACWYRPCKIELDRPRLRAQTKLSYKIRKHGVAKHCAARKQRLEKAFHRSYGMLMLKKQQCNGFSKLQLARKQQFRRMKLYGPEGEISVVCKKQMPSESTSTTFCD